MKEQVFIATGVDKSKASVREPLDGAFCLCPIPQKTCVLQRCRKTQSSGCSTAKGSELPLEPNYGCFYKEVREVSPDLS